VEKRIRFHYTAGDVRYYLLTGGTGFASARFHYPRPVLSGESLVVPAMRCDSSCPPPFTDGAPPAPLI